MRHFAVIFTVLTVTGAATYSRAQGSYFFGADFATDESEGAADKMEKGFKEQGWKPTGLRKNVPPKGLKENIKKDLASAFDGEKFKCSNGVIFIYIIAHGQKSLFGQRRDFVTKSAASLQDFTKWVSGTIPECCTLILGVDACGTKEWQDANFSEDGVKPESPLSGINCVVAMPFNTMICEGPTVGNAINKTFGQRINTGQYHEKLGESQGVRAIRNLDENHMNTPVTVPEPSSLIVATAAIALSVRRSRACRPSKSLARFAASRVAD